MLLMFSLFSSETGLRDLVIYKKKKCFRLELILEERDVEGKGMEIRIPLEKPQRPGLGTGITSRPECACALRQDLTPEPNNPYFSGGYGLLTTILLAVLLIMLLEVWSG